MKYFFLIIFSVITIQTASAHSVPQDVVGSCQHSYNTHGKYYGDDSFRALYHDDVLYVREGNGKNERTGTYYGQDENGKSIIRGMQLAPAIRSTITDFDSGKRVSYRVLAFGLNPSGHCIFDKSEKLSAAEIKQFISGDMNE